MKSIPSLVSVTVLLVLWTANGLADQSGDFGFSTNISDPNSVTITNYTGSSSSLTIPSIIDGKRVTRLGNELFANNWDLRNVTIQDGVSSIGASAFYTCRYMTNVVMTSSVTNIERSAFSSCYDLKSVTLSTGIKIINDETFYRCSRLVDITLPDGIVSLGMNAFMSCDSLEKITIPNGVVSVGVQAFWGCEKLKSIDLPDSVTTLGGGAFRYCDALSTVTISGDIGKIGADTFYDCARLTNVIIAGEVTAIGGSAFGSCSSLVDITLPPSLITIGNYAFSRCTSLINFSCPIHVTNIGIEAFGGNANLKAVYFRGTPPSNVNPFEGTSSHYPDSPDIVVYYIPDQAGWGESFGARPTAIWHPSIEMDAKRSNDEGALFGFNICWSYGHDIMVETKESLFMNWSPLETVSLTNDVVFYSVPDLDDHEVHFYRVSMP